MILKITKNIDPIWKRKFSDIDPKDKNLKRIVADMQETLSFTMGVGLAAPQVGLPYRMFIVDYADLTETFINPKIISKNTETDFVEEGCLSIPGVRGLVERFTELEVEYDTLSGEHKKAHLTGFYARIIQHEYDHLSSTFYLDRIKKEKYIYRFDPIKLVFFGSAELSAAILFSLLGQSMVGDYEIQLVVTSSDKPVGRGQKLQSSPVKTLAEQFKLPVISPERLAKKEANTFKLTNQEVYQQIKNLKPDILVLVAYGKILPKEILAIPKIAPINIHPSLLPKYRGPAPLQAPIIKGDKYTGVTIMKMTEKMDEGDIYLKARYLLKPDETAQTLEKSLESIAKDLTHHVIHYLALKKMKSRPQDPAKASYTKLIHKEDGKIDLNKPPKNLERMIRAYYPWPGVWGDYNGKVLKLLPNHMVQLEGKNPVSLNNFKSGHKDFTLKW